MTATDPHPPSLAERAVSRRMAGAEQSARAEVDALLDAGLKLMTEGAPRAPRVADIVAAAGLSNDAFYRAFSGRDALVEAIVERGARELAGQVRRRMERATGDSAEDRLRAGIAAVVRQAADPRLAAGVRAVLAAAVTPVPHAGHAIVVLVDGLGSLFAGPARELGAADSVRAGRTIAGAAVAALQHWLLSGHAPDEADVEQLKRFLVAGARS
ncbi:TetR/AcrR family transcriptional regulator [Streptomyces sp. NBC_01352]|uniref:TetR/AcrR family transcriptional regulator n=1 Tax=Streptomyces sp. NBC_01352 TaxID=2903834 RepID=UPI002E3335BA|nr:TetR/AcrR family transcriptional regulator [Streptomyces sp. NBC_01352]